MDLQAIPPRPPSTARSLLRFVHDRNPFYLLSALSMFVGFRVVLAALDSAPGDGRTLLGLIVTMQAYELVMIALALFLIVRRGLVRDGWILLGVESLFLVDLTNLNAELFTAWPRAGAVVNTLCWVLAMGKVAVVVRTLRLRLTTGTAAYVAVQLAFLLALPGVFRVLRSSSEAVSPAHVYAVWWAAGLLVAVGAFAVRRHPTTTGNGMAALPGRLYVAVPLVSLLVHLASENRVYWVHFEPANLAPLLLAAVVAVNRGRRNPLQLQWSLALVVMAVAVSVVPAGSAMTTHVLAVALSPLRATLAAAAVVTAGVAVRHRAVLLGGVVAACVVLAVLGGSVPDIVGRIERAGQWLLDRVCDLVPTTALQWGYTAIASAFLLLGVGAVVSLRSGATPPPRETA